MKYTYIIIQFLIIFNIEVSAQEVLERKDFSFGMGMALLSGCGSGTEEVNSIKEKTKFCIAIPTLDLSVGYHFTPQVKVNFEVQTLMVGGFVGVEAQYYINDKVESAYVYTGATRGYMLEEGFSQTLGNIGVGYAKEHMEYEVGVMGKNADVLVDLSIKYMF